MDMTFFFWDYWIIGGECLLHSECHEFAVNPLSPFEEVHPFYWRMTAISIKQSRPQQVRGRFPTISLRVECNFR